MILVYNILLCLYLVWVARELYRLPCKDYLVVALILIVALGIVTFTGIILCSTSPFCIIQLLCWTVFLYFPLLLIVYSIWCRKHIKIWCYLCRLIATLLFAIAIDAFFIEPHWLEITHKTIQCPRLQRPIRVAILADIQTDVPGEYESDVFQYVKKASPDLVLFVGDYIQTEKESHYTTLGKKLNTILHNADFNVPMGAYAIKGNIDHAHSWKNIFAGLPIRTIEETTTIDLGPLVLTGLSVADSFDSSFSIDGNEKFHLVFGHCPDFSLGGINADLLIAGHTHGGQVRLPGIGPLLTLCKISRDWASGLNRIKEGQFLYVSRGIGIERHDAPRMRFLCRPELVILDLQP